MCLVFGWPGFSYYFDRDDIMNLRKAAGNTISYWVADCFAFRVSSYRPLGSLFHAALYQAAGMRPDVFRAACVLLLLVNIWLLFLFAREITGSVEAGLIAALLGCFHSRMSSLFSSIGNVYDILCYTLFFAAFLLYGKVMKASGARRYALAGATLALQLLALDAKEVAVMLPVALVCYEALWPTGTSWRRFWLIGALSMLTAIFFVPKMLLHSPLSDGYPSEYTAARFFLNWNYYLGHLFYSFHAAPLWIGVGSIAALWAVALILRSRPLIFCSCLVLLLALPVSFIPTRGLNVWYMASAGWACYLAALLRHLLRRASPRIHMAAFALVFVALATAHALDRPYRFVPNEGFDQSIREFERQATALLGTPRPDVRILFLNDPFESNEWTLSGVLQLHYHNPEMDIQRVKLPEQREMIAGTSYGYVFDYKDGKVVLTGLHQK